MTTFFTNRWNEFLGFLHWLRSIWSEADGNGSTTRVLMFILVSFIVGVGVSFAVATHQKIITIEQFNAFLQSGGLFITTTVPVIYGINKMADWASSKNNNTSTTTTATPLAVTTTTVAPVSTTTSNS